MPDAPIEQPVVETPTGDVPAKTDEAKFTQADIDRIVKERLDRAQKQAEEKAKKAQTEAETEQLRKQGEFEKVAQQEKARADELAPFKERAERYEAALKAQLEKAREGLPKSVLAVLDKLDPAEQLEHIVTIREEIDTTTRTTGGRVAGMPSGNAGRITSEESERARQQDMLATRRLF
jgi:multidrug efflux pump subunit AcrA (membrane-fusion protein)